MREDKVRGKGKDQDLGGCRGIDLAYSRTIASDATSMSRERPSPYGAMTEETEAGGVTKPPETPGNTAAEGLYGWRLAGLLVCAALALTLGLYWESAASAVDLWWNRSAYNHGFLILPISLYLIWDRRETLAAMAPEPDILGLVVVAGFSLAWTVARSAGINEAEHFALVGVFQGVVLAVLGRQLFLAMLLPMTYLWLMVPTGAMFYPLLQGAAHWMTVVMLQASGIPVYAEGFFVQVPTGVYEIAEGCSGLNFILAGLALSPLFGYMMYDGMRKRLIAIFAMLGIAVIANGIRIYVIIALAEFTDRRIDIVDDHLIYGWGFFAAILFVMGLIGARFSDPARPLRTEAQVPAAHIKRSKLVTGGILAMAALAVLPLYRLAAMTSGSGAGAQEISIAGLQLEAVEDVSGEWLPDYPWATKEHQFRGTRNSVTADVYLAGYFNPRDAREMVTSGNDLVGNPLQDQLGGFSRQIESAKGPVNWRFIRLGARTNQRLVARAWQVDGEFVSSTVKAKLLQARATLLWSKKGSGVILVSVPVTNGIKSAEDQLMQFLQGADVADLFSAGQTGSAQLDPSADRP